MSLSLLKRGPENPDVEDLIETLREMDPNHVVRWGGTDGDKTASQMIYHLEVMDEVALWYLDYVRANGWRPSRMQLKERFKKSLAEAHKENPDDKISCSLGTFTLREAIEQVELETEFGEFLLRLFQEREKPVERGGIRGMLLDALKRITG